MSQDAIQTTSFINNFDQLSKRRVDDESVAWLKDLRQQSLARFTDLGVPTVKDEEWKYTNLSSVIDQTFDIKTQKELSELDQFKSYCQGDKILVVFVNGHLSTELSDFYNLPKGLTVLPLAEALVSHGDQIKELLAKYEAKDSTSFIALSTALTDNGVFVSVDANAVISDYVHIVHVTSSTNGEALSLPRSVVFSGKSSEATILESHISFDRDNTYFTNALTDIHLAENATLHYTKAQHESMKAYHINNTRIWQEQNSNLDSISVMTGSALNRNNLDIVLNGEGINSTLNGLYCVYGSQHVDNHTSVDHRFPNCISNQLYKGILNESSRAVFNGKIFVNSIAQQTNSYQLNKNLLLGSDCRVDTKPQLEIFADDVRCTHGATVGQLNEDELFYLQTRCIDKIAARKMLARGFVDDLLVTVQNKSIHQKLQTLLEPAFAQL